MLLEALYARQMLKHTGATSVQSVPLRAISVVSDEQAWWKTETPLVFPVPRVAAIYVGQSHRQIHPDRAVLTVVWSGVEWAYSGLFPMLHSLCCSSCVGSGV